MPSDKCACGHREDDHVCGEGNCGLCFCDVYIKDTTKDKD